MKQKLLKTTALVSSMLLAIGATSSANAAPHSSSSLFVASSTEGTLNAIAPLIQIYQMAILTSLLQNHLYMLQLGQRGNTPSSPDMSGNFTGIAAGEQSSALTDKLSIWASANYSEAESDFAPTAYKSETVGGSVGVDYILSDYVTLGAFLSYNDTDTNSSFNGGSADTQAITFGPYASFVVDDMFSIDASIAYTTSDIDNSRTVGAVVATGNQDGDSTYISVGLNAMKWYDNIGVSGRLGWGYSDTDNDAYTDSLGTAFAATDSQLGQISLGGKVSYYGGSYMPYIGATYKYDAVSDNVTTVTPPSPANDKDEVQLEAGISLFGDGPLSGGISGSYTVLREEFDGWGVGGNISYRF
ncbi:MAG: autotransporter outer membrane beta-barrel domain-containing protein [Rhodobiaceae bacterium]|nr:autotransporter outer membrane beta-barrel domain-containing protein [Rhodobiaceae bacterium]